MTRIVAVSDSHGMVSRLRTAIELAQRNGKIDIFVFLGDGLSDLHEIKPLLLSRDPGVRMIAVRGNNDFSSAALTTEEFCVQGRTFFATHGHSYHVKWGLNRLSYAAQERNAAVTLYGHTHASHLEEACGLWLINPGAVCNVSNRGSAYAEVFVEDNGLIRPSLIHWSGEAL